MTKIKRHTPEQAIRKLRDIEVMLAQGKKLELVLREAQVTVAVFYPRPRTVNRLAVDVEPPADIQENLLSIFIERAIGFGRHVQEHVSILADDVHQLVNDFVDAAVLGACVIAPRAD